MRSWPKLKNVKLDARERTNKHMYNKTSSSKRRLVHEKFIIIILSGGYIRTSLTDDHNKISFLKQFLVFTVGLVVMFSLSPLVKQSYLTFWAHFFDVVVVDPVFAPLT